MAKWNSTVCFPVFYRRIDIISPARPKWCFLYAFVLFGWNLVGNHEGDLYADADTACYSLSKEISCIHLDQLGWQWKGNAVVILGRKNKLYRFK